ncbi:DUF502 domain-containing protein [Candidatus Neptunochlamydia vexilliferae]|uniref:DUF502 domain-containing protein n=1 Tax=Candidatus Neptunichlamydia vexilliferae TaxID=1651774 RepID=A0ABS0AYP7_9BACT|nr:DUF502 domain-containing protein [Candidatus Neptunochlamydia vexilliferae]MBF5059255.1 hypothetical protein [Candidatus Neptunochlamydia vexilliferae]
MKKTFLAGLATLLPITITLVVVVFIVDVLTAPFAGMVSDFITGHGLAELGSRHKYILLFVSRIIVLILLFFLTLFLGFLGRRIFFSWIIKLTDRIFAKIPFIKTIYRISREVSSSVFSERKKQLFKGTVTVPFPHEKTRAMGLLSGDPPEEITEKKKDLQSIFIPTAPHPISGFLVMYQKDEIKETNLETEDLLKFLLSCGIYHPEEEKDA